MAFRNKILIVFCAAIIVRLIFSMGLFISDQPLVSTIGDAPSYIQTAKNFLEKGVWSSDPADDLKPDNIRTPVYPLFLMIFFWLGIPLVWVAFVQDILMAFSAVLIYFLGRKLFKDSVAFAAGLVWAVEPYLASSFVSKAVMTEVFAILFLIIAVFNLAIYIAEKKGRNLIWGSIFLGFAALTKPQLLYFLPFVLLAFFLAKGKKQWKFLVLSYLIVFILISPWLYYNFFILKTFQFSSVAPLSLYVLGDYFEQWRNRSNSLEIYEYPVMKAQRILEVDYEELIQPENTARLAKMGRDTIIAHPFSFVFYYATHLHRLLWHDTTIETIAADFGLDYVKNLKQGEMDINIIKNFFRGNLSSAFDDLSNHPIWLVSLLLKAIFLFLGILSLANFFLKWKFAGEMSKVSLFLLVFLILYIGMIGVFGHQRYRVLIEAFVFILAFDSIRLIYKRLK